MTAQNARRTEASKQRVPEQRQRPVDDDPDFQRRQWRAERIGWVVMLIIIVAALSGVFGGGGFFAQSSASGASGAGSVHYARFARYASPTTLEVNVASAAARQVRVRVSDEYLSAMKVRAITPPPTATGVADRQHVFVFERSAPPGTATIRFELEPGSLGVQRGWVAVDDGAPISFAHFIYP